MNRRQNFQNIAWFNDLYKRELLDLDPPYQRRSVWTQTFRDYFIETILFDYPAPTIFLYEEITDSGVTTYNVVDGKQRLTTIFCFINNEFPVSEDSAVNELKGRYFQDFSSDQKNTFWSYTFSVEYLPTKDDSIINNIFDRINRNVAKLTAQELRHAKYSGDFISTCEILTDWMFGKLPINFPQIAKRSKSQMKDVELVAQILLRIEGELKGYNTDELDIAFGSRDDFWGVKDDVEDKFKSLIKQICSILEEDTENTLIRSRLKNQADFYSLIGALYSINKEDRMPENEVVKNRLIKFVNYNLDQELSKDINDYYEYAKAASNRTIARKRREKILMLIILDEIEY
ncbi:MAG: DUF262 domain-containing protein [Bacteroidales bacterium]|nr:DUF262 domain-containing protein [Bacteroidales bacterium]